MKNENIAKVLKEARKKNHLSVKEVSKLLSEKYSFVAEKTIYGWESGQSQPDADTLLVLCDIYHIDDILGTFGYTEKSNFIITKYEQTLIKHYREHPELHEAIAKLLDLS